MFLRFDEGADLIETAGFPATVYFLLSTKDMAMLSVADTLAGGVGEITGTGYIRISQALPAPVAGVIAFTVMEWDVGAAADWPSDVRSVIAASTVDNSGRALCAWDLLAVRDLSQPGTRELVTPTYIQ